MRVLLAGLVVFAAMLGTVAIIGASYGNGPWPWWAKFAPASAMFVAIGIAMYIFNPKWSRPSFSRQSKAERIAKLEAEGLVERRKFRAARAFGVQEFEDEGLHYYLELAGGGVLFLSGQYLYDYEPISNDPEVNQPRLFPCEEFEVLRHKEAGYVVGIQCNGLVLEPEVIAPSFGKSVWGKGIPEDGQIILDKSYDDLKAERIAV